MTTPPRSSWHTRGDYQLYVDSTGKLIGKVSDNHGLFAAWLEDGPHCGHYITQEQAKAAVENAVREKRAWWRR